MTRKVLIAIVSILVFAAILSAVVWNVQKREGQKQTQQEGQEEMETQEQEGQLEGKVERNEEDVEIDTSNWKTYRNEEMGFEIRYPGFLQIQEYKSDEFKDSIFAVFFKKEIVGGILIQIKNSSFDPDYVVGIHGTIIDREHIKEKTFGDLKMYYYASGDAGCHGNIVYIPNNNRTITINIIDCIDDEIKIVSNEDAVLSSFRFIK